MLKRVFVTLLFVFASHPSMATELDSFTRRYEPLADSRVRLDEIVNEMLQESIAQANRDGSCSEKHLYAAINESVGGFLYSKIETAIEQDPFIEQRKEKRTSSIYKYTSFWQAPVLYLQDLGSVLKFGDYLVGTDKFGHFLDTGYYYFKIAYLNGAGEEAAFKYGETTERTFYGRSTTGVYSFGDLVANYQGMLFWKELIGKYTEVDTPYISCVDDEWIQTRVFSWGEFVDAGWDEGINCNKYRNDFYEDDVYDAIYELEENDPDPSHVYVCPIRQEECSELVDAYGDLAERMISPLCF